VTRRATDDTPEEIELAREWQAASRYIRELETRDNAAADVGELTNLPVTIASAAEEALRRPDAQRNYGVLTPRWSLVNLEKVTIWQWDVNLTFARRIAASLPPNPSDRQLLELSLGQTAAEPPLSVTTINGCRYSFSSPSTDLRVIGVTTLQPRHVTGFQPYGRTCVVLGVFVGYGTNYMTAVHMKNRLVLTNGTHRAHALYARGIRNAPCVVLSISHPEEIDFLDMADSSERLNWHFSTARPPLLRDYFDHRLVKEFAGKPCDQQIHVKLEIERLKITR
jgi:hypothetical protein